MDLFSSACRLLSSSHGLEQEKLRSNDSFLNSSLLASRCLLDVDARDLGGGYVGVVRRNGAPHRVLAGLLHGGKHSGFAAEDVLAVVVYAHPIMLAFAFHFHFVFFAVVL